MWNTIVNDLRKLKNIQAKAAEVATKQVELEAKFEKCKFYHMPAAAFDNIFIKFVNFSDQNDLISAFLLYALGSSLIPSAGTRTTQFM